MESQKQIDTAWNQFWAGEDPDAEITGVRQEILDSWKRSRAFGINPYHMKKTVLSPEQLARRIRKNQNLYDVAVPFMDNLHSFDEGSGFLTLLCDSEGYVLRIFGEPQAVAAARGNLLVEGAARNESHIGTNAIGTCLYLKKPLSIHANEHFYKPHSMWSCMSSPIFNSGQRLIGVLCLSAYWDRVTYHTPGLVIATTEAISKQIALLESLSRITAMNDKLDQVVELMSYGVIFANSNGIITQINSLAILQLNLKNADKDSIIGTNVYEYIPQEQLNISKIFEQEHAEEFSLNTFLGPLHCSVFPLASERKKALPEIVITIRQAEHVHKMVNRIVGSSAHFTLENIIGRSKQILEAKRLAQISAPYLSNVLLTGESGTGKEIFAQAIHNASPRANAPFVALNCGAIPRSLIESELFGYEGGTFTGSKKEGQAGKFELANGGTIFLDEIGDMPFDVQVNLLRVLQSREIVRIGGKKSIKIDVRVISATNKDLDEGIKNKSFRQDLYYRLNVFSVRIPPLREREGDVRILCDYMLMKYASGFGKSMLGLSEEAYKLLKQYDWPGNVRELENVIERAVLVAQDNYVKPEDLPPIFSEKSIPKSTSKIKPAVKSASMAEEELISNTLDRNNGNIRKVSADLGLSRGTLYRKIEKYNIDLGKYRSEQDC